MSAALLILIVLFILLASSLSLYRQHRRRRRALEAGAPRSVFAPGYSGLFGEMTARESVETAGQEVAGETRAALLRRARAGEMGALEEAHATSDRGLYDETLDLLVGHHGAARSSLRELAAFLTSRPALRANRRLATAFLDTLETPVEAPLATTALHLAALADDAESYAQAVEYLFELWRRGALPGITATDFLSLIESQYWCLASEARRSGAGFLLKRRIVSLRRELGPPDRQPPDALPPSTHFTGQRGPL